MNAGAPIVDESGEADFAGLAASSDCGATFKDDDAEACT